MHPRRIEGSEQCQAPKKPDAPKKKLKRVEKAEKSAGKAEKSKGKAPKKADNSVKKLKRAEKSAKAEKAEKKRKRRIKRKETQEKVVLPPYTKLIARFVFAGVFGKVPVLRVVVAGEEGVRSCPLPEQHRVCRDAVEDTDLGLLRLLAPELMRWVEDGFLSSDSMYKLCAEGTEGREFPRKGAADVVYFHRCILWLSRENGPAGYSSAYEYYERNCYAAVRYILHQLWFPPQQVLFAFALARALKDEASTKKFVSKDSDVPRALIKAALSLMPKNLTDINKAAKRARTEPPASKHSVAWLLRRATIPGLLISLHGDKHTAEWVRGAWISDDEGWAALIAAGSSYKHMLQSARSLLELQHVFQADDDKVFQADDDKEVSKRRELFVASVEPAQRALG